MKPWSLGEQGALPVEIELMPIFEKDLGDWTVIVNAPDLKKVIVGANHMEFFELGYRSEVRYSLSHRLRLGLQPFGGIGQSKNITPTSQQQQYLIPVVHTISPGMSGPRLVWPLDSHPALIYFS